MRKTEEEDPGEDRDRQRGPERCGSDTRPTTRAQPPHAPSSHSPPSARRAPRAAMRERASRRQAEYADGPETPGSVFGKQGRESWRPINRSADGLNGPEQSPGGGERRCGMCLDGSVLRGGARQSCDWIASHYSSGSFRRQPDLVNRSRGGTMARTRHNDPENPVPPSPGSRVDPEPLAAPCWQCCGELRAVMPCSPR